MAVYDHEEQEQLEELKAWWRTHGNTVLNVLLVAAVIACGNFGWKWWKNKQANEASALYGQLQMAASQHDTKQTRDLSGALVDKYSGTAYASLGALISAKVQADGGDAKNAKAQLTWVAEKGADQGLRDLARLRLAGLLLDDKEYDQALAQLSADPLPSYGARYGELKGDIYVAQGKKNEARTAYQAAIERVDQALKAGGADAENPGTPIEQREAAYRELLKAKLDAQGSAS